MGASSLFSAVTVSYPDISSRVCTKLQDIWLIVNNKNFLSHMFEPKPALLNTLGNRVNSSYESRLDFGWVFNVRVQPTFIYVYT